MCYNKNPPDRDAISKNWPKRKTAWLITPHKTTLRNKSFFMLMFHVKKEITLSFHTWADNLPMTFLMY